MITEEDDGRHPAGPGKLWNESYYYNFYDSDTETGGFTRIGLRENLKESNAWCLLFKKGRPVYNRFLTNLPYTEAGMDQGLTVGGLTYRTIKPLQSAKVEFLDRETGLDLVWKALHPMVEIGATGDRLPETVTSAHLEQGGEVTGSVTLRGKKTLIQGYGFRDHAWGIRDWESMDHYDLAWPIFGRDFLFGCIAISMMDGSTNHVGFLFDGKDNLGITVKDLHLEFDDDGLTQRSIALCLTDEKGRDWEVTGKRIAKFILPLDGFMINETMFEYRTQEGLLGYGISERGVRL